MIEPTCDIFFKWQKTGMSDKIVRCGNVGENTTLKTRLSSTDWKLVVKFEYTARDTPQQNSYTEVGIATLLKRANAMMIAVNISYEWKYTLFREAIKMATLLDALVVLEIDGVTETRVGTLV